MRRDASLVLIATMSAGCSLVVGLDGLAGAPEGASEGGASEGATQVDAAESGASECAGVSGCKVLASNQGTPTELVSSSGQLYWASAAQDGNVRKVSANGGVPIDVGSLPSARALAVTTSGVFGIEGSGALLRLDPRSSCVPSPNAAFRLASNDQALFALNPDSIYAGACGSMTSIIAHPSTALAVDPTNSGVIWYGRTLGDVQTCSTDACFGSQKRLVPDQGRIEAMTVDATGVYWVANADTAAEIRTKPKSQILTSTAATVLATGERGATTLVSADGMLYWTNVEKGAVRKVPTSGGAATLVATGLKRPWGLVVGASFLYVTESGAGRVLALPR